MSIFTEQNELIRYAIDFINKRTVSLKKDVEHCIQEPYAPFPALLYCFSTIDLLGALYKGNAAKSTNQSEEYLKKFMRYTKEERDLLMKIFRHKIVHLAQPKSVVEYNGNLISWRYYHEKHKDHRKVIHLSHRVKSLLVGSTYIEFTHLFNISITGLMEDILESANNPEGYLATLKSDKKLQNNFEKAYANIYNPRNR